MYKEDEIFTEDIKDTVVIRPVVKTTLKLRKTASIFPGYIVLMNNELTQS